MIVECRLSGRDQLLKMPYRPSIGNGSRNNGYIDLPSEPHRISELHELIGFPELMNVIRKLIQPNHVLMPWRIDSGFDVFSMGNLRRSVYIFLTIAFRSPGTGDQTFYEDLITRFQERAEGQGIPDSSRTLFCLTPFEERPGGLDRKGYCLDIWIQGFGSDRREALAAWKRGMSVLDSCLVF
jgi:hypothetical protein